jgi:hypothetical protein
MAVEASQGFIGSIMKRMLGGRRKKPTAPKATTRKSAQQVKAPPPHVVKVSFEVGSKTPEEKSKLVGKIQELNLGASSGRVVLSALAKAGLKEASAATRAEIVIDDSSRVVSNLRSQ